MKLPIHFFASLILAIILYPFYKWSVLYLFIGGFLIDFDHYLLYIFKFKNLSVKDALRYYNAGNYRDVLSIFHTVEFMFVFFLFCLYFNLSLLLIGYVIHTLLDLTEAYKYNLFHRRAFSLIGWIMRRV